jgi:hypothetical protein
VTARSQNSFGVTGCRALVGPADEELAAEGTLELVALAAGPFDGAADAPRDALDARGGALGAPFEADGAPPPLCPHAVMIVTTSEEAATA